MMTYAVRVGKNGRITIPIEIRRELKLQTGDTLLIERLDTRIILRKPTEEERVELQKQQRSTGKEARP